MPSPHGSTISLPEMKTALTRSGYLLEARVAHAFHTRDFLVEPNTGYRDPVTGKTRELDVSALHGDHIFPEADGPDTFNFAWISVLCECVNNAQPIAFISRPWRPIAFDLDKVHVAGMPDSHPGLATDNTLPHLLAMHEYHHYFRRSRLATQFCTFTRKRGTDSEWMASHDEDNYGAFVKLGDAVEQAKSSLLDTWGPSSTPAEEPINFEVYYPIYVLQNDLFELVETGKGDVELEPVDQVLFRRSGRDAR